MSGFWGELSLSGARADPEHAGAMDAAMSSWPSDSANRWSEGPIALGARLLRVTSWDALDSQPQVEPDLVFVGHVRLDRRASLGHELGLDPATLASTPDSRLLIEAWRTWGESCAEHLYGDWVCAIWNRERQTLWLGRDAAGNTGLHYWHDAGRLVFSTSLRALLAHPVVPRRPNAYHIARQLAVFSDPGESESTAWESIRRLPGGHAIRCDLANVETYEWWHPEALSEINLPDDESYEAFRQIYSDAVADRLSTARGPVALMLSAGLDSGSVAALAAPMLLTRGERLIAYTSVPRFSPDGAPGSRIGDEEVLARATASHAGNTEFVPVASADAGIVASIEEMLRVHHHPQHAASNQYWIFDILKKARNRGARVLLTGQGGNATVSWTGYGNLWHSLLRGDLAAVTSAFMKSETGAWTTLKRQIVKPVLLPVRDSWERLRTRGAAPWAAHSAIHPRFAEEIHLHDRLRAAEQDPSSRKGYSPRHPAEARFRLGRLASAHLGAAWMDLGAAYEMDVRDPTRDRRLIEFCWRLPDRVFWANGLRRGLITRGMRGLLPDSVVHSRRKGLQAADIGHRVLAERERIAGAIARVEAHPLARGWLDVARMRSVLDSLQQGITPENTAEAGAILLRGLGAGLFLTRF